MPGDIFQFVRISATQRPVLVTCKNWSVKRLVGPKKRELLAGISTKTTEIFGQTKHLNVSTHEGTNTWDSSRGPSPLVFRACFLFFFFLEQAL